MPLRSFFPPKPPSDVSSEVVFFFPFHWPCRKMRLRTSVSPAVAVDLGQHAQEKKEKEKEEACWMLFYHLAVVLCNAANSCSIKDSLDFLLHTH